MHKTDNNEDEHPRTRDSAEAEDSERRRNRGGEAIRTRTSAAPTKATPIATGTVTTGVIHHGSRRRTKGSRCEGRFADRSSAGASQDAEKIEEPQCRDRHGDQTPGGPVWQLAAVRHHEERGGQADGAQGGATNAPRPLAGRGMPTLFSGRTFGFLLFVLRSHCVLRWLCAHARYVSCAAPARHVGPGWRA